MIASDTVIGSISIDLEERWLALKHLQPSKRELRSGVKKGKTLWLPPNTPSPVEIVPLSKGTISEGSGVSTGYLRYIVDMVRERQSLKFSDQSRISSNGLNPVAGLNILLL